VKGRRAYGEIWSQGEGGRGGYGCELSEGGEGDLTARLD
jgi:hypothetical protein